MEYKEFRKLNTSSWESDYKHLIEELKMEFDSAKEHFDNIDFYADLSEDENFGMFADEIKFIANSLIRDVLYKNRYLED